MDGIIYMVKNIMNNKIYIGQTINSLSRRKNGHIHAVNRNSQLYFHRALRKYGECSFEWSVLEKLSDVTLEQINEREMYYINLYQSNNPSLGYNMTKGGDAYAEMSQSFWDDDSKSAERRQELSRR